ncbi:hypothetical protein LQR30_15665 [Chromobacterium piscinae]|uniref:hypothetical protein n=1 Tax=Chromobacterium piscinae TaxID=686831 RepID=UPI001E651534|nr:hypothetical protein [Chromobacterium piscinae]MCD4505536.1 hypothetical protein [Chromobacterium piscinae]
MKSNLYLKCLVQAVVGCLVGKALFLMTWDTAEKFISPSLFVYMTMLFMVRVYYEKKRLKAAS